MEIDTKFIQDNFTSVDCRDVVKAAGKFTSDYVRMIAMGTRKNDEILKMLHENIKIRLAQNKSRIEDVKKFNFNKDQE